MTDLIPFNVYTIGALALLGLVAYGYLVANWSKLRDRFSGLFGSRVSKELDRESADFDAFVAKARATVDATAAAKKSAIDQIAAAVKQPPSPPPAA